MLRSIGFAALGLMGALWTSAVQAEAVTTTPDWDVNYKKARATHVCVLSARLGNGATFDLKVFGERNVALLTISSPGWRSTELGRPHSISARFSQEDEIGFRTSEALGGVKGVIFVVDTPFLKRLAVESSIDFKLSGESETAKIDLAAAAEPLRALERCVINRFGADRVAQRFEAIGWSSPAG